MNPREFYNLMAAGIGDEDCQRVLNIMAEHIGEVNAVRLSSLTARLRMPERKIRDILEQLAVVHGVPIGAHAGTAGRWIILNEEERWAVANDLLSREVNLRKRRMAIERAHLPSPKDLSGKAPQLGLWK